MEQGGVVVQIIETVSKGIELIGVAVIVLAFLYAIVRSIAHWGQKKGDAYDRLRVFIGKALQLGLEFLVAADIIRTVLIEPTLQPLLALGVLIIVRTVLSWSITVDLEGCWPWQVAKNKKEQ
jgi:uncharacterized membrane protein